MSVTQPRLPLVPAGRAGLLTRLGYSYARRRYGAVPDPFASPQTPLTTPPHRTSPSRNGWLNSALGITAQGFTSGEACRVPSP
jgi:hypothetical protein